MSGLTLSAIREALADTLRTSIARDVTVRPYRPAPAMGPWIIIDSNEDYLDYWLSFGEVGLAKVRFDLIISAVGPDYESSLRRIDDFLSAGTGNNSSVIEALMVDPSLGLTNVTSHIQNATADADTATATITVEIHVNKES